MHISWKEREWNSSWTDTSSEGFWVCQDNDGTSKCETMQWFSANILAIPLVLCFCCEYGTCSTVLKHIMVTKYIMYPLSWSILWSRNTYARDIYNLISYYYYSNLTTWIISCGIMRIPSIEAGYFHCCCCSGSFDESSGDECIRTSSTIFLLLSQISFTLHLQSCTPVLKYVAIQLPYVSYVAKLHMAV